MNATQQLALTALAALWFVLPVQAAHRYRLTDLGDLSGEHESTMPLGINDAVQVVGWIRAPSTRAFTWTSADGMRDVGALPGHLYSEAWGIDNAGRVVGFSWNNNPSPEYRGFLWTNTGGMQSLTGLTAAYDINNVGQVVGEASPRRAALWTSTGGVQDLGVLPGHSSSIPWAINDVGQVVGQSESQSSYRAFIWTSSGGMQDLGDLPSGTDFSVARDINDAGQVVGNSWTPTGSRAFLWTSTGGIQDIGALPGYDDSSAYGINDGGLIVGESGGPQVFGQSRRAFLWTSAEGIQDLSARLDTSGTGWVLYSARAINYAGQIVGNGSNPDGHSHAYLLTPVPQLPGDYNQNGTVDAADYVVWRKSGGLQEGYNTWRANFGQSDSINPLVPGDYNLDGTVDAADYVVWRKNEGTTNALPNDPIGGTIGPAHYAQWRTNFGQTVGIGSGSNTNRAIPEPATIVPLIMGMITMCVRQRAIVS